MNIVLNALEDRRRLEKENESLLAKLIWIKGFLAGLAERPLCPPELRADIHKALKVIKGEKE